MTRESTPVPSAPLPPEADPGPPEQPPRNRGGSAANTAVVVAVLLVVYVLSPGPVVGAMDMYRKRYSPGLEPGVLVIFYAPLIYASDEVKLVGKFYNKYIEGCSQLLESLLPPVAPLPTTGRPAPAPPPPPVPSTY
ncbi:hypothetical protein DB346_06680 [Verrucomicrobia bacterium LW23]|nr:hypothetical protein DB346_06680 [Verrucomicrobia bacterium LW23]